MLHTDIDILIERPFPVCGGDRHGHVGTRQAADVHRYAAVGIAVDSLPRIPGKFDLVTHGHLVVRRSEIPVMIVNAFEGQQYALGSLIVLIAVDIEQIGIFPALLFRCLRMAESLCCGQRHGLP